MSDAVVRTVGELRAAVAPALREILTEEELAATTVRVVRLIDFPEDWKHVRELEALSDDDPLDEETSMRIRTFDDEGGIWVQGLETAAELYERVRSDLQDFVAESRFGWGQLRP